MPFSGIIPLTALALLVMSAGAGATEFRVRVDPDLDTVDVEACFDAFPDSLYAGERLRESLDTLQWNGRRIEAEFGRYSLQLPESPRGGCLAYTTRLEDRGQRWLELRGDARVTDPRDWLLMPWQGTRAELRFELPAGMTVSAPWPPLDGQKAYRLGLTDPYWKAAVAIGRFHTDSVRAGGTRLRLAVLPGGGGPDNADTRAWVAEAADAVGAVHGALPFNAPQVMVVPVGASSEPTPYARVLRGGGVGLQFFVDPTRPVSQFSADWTATHEFSHLLLPYVSRNDAWLSEGLASYYQNVLRSRDGRLAQQQAWSELLSGFERGRRGARRGFTLDEAARDWSGRGATMRIYWSGAAIMLKADVELRRQTDGRQSLDTALAAFAECCIAPGRVWQADELLRRLDRLTGTRIFSSLRRRYERSDEFPEVTTTLRRLGVVERDSRVRLDEEAPLAGVRDAIMGDRD